MPADAPNPQNRARLLTYLFWGGIGVALFAALLLIVAGSSTTGLRVAAILAILAVVAIGVSITLRRDVATVKVDLQESMLDEMDLLRSDVRADITTAARATHRALSEKVAQLHQSLDEVRRQVEAVSADEMDRAELGRGPSRAVIGPPPGARAVGAGPTGSAAVGGPPGVVHRTEAVRVTTRTIDPEEQPYELSGGQPVREASPSGSVYGSGREQRAAEWSSGEWSDGQRGDGEAGSAERRHGRATHDDPSVRDDRGARDHGGHGRDPRSRDVRRADAVPSDFEVAARRAWSDTSDDLARDPRWADMRAGDRWAEVRQDEHGREVRVAERRATVRTDETGTHLRVIDRWSTIREDHRPSPATDTFENTGETRAQRREREEAERGGWEQPSTRPELPRGGDGRRAAADAPSSAPIDAASGGHRRSDDGAPRSRRHADSADWEYGPGWRDPEPDPAGPDRSDRYQDEPDRSGPTRRRPSEPDRSSWSAAADDYRSFSPRPLESERPAWRSDAGDAPPYEPHAYEPVSYEPAYEPPADEPWTRQATQDEASDAWPGRPEVDRRSRAAERQRHDDSNAWDDGDRWTGTRGAIPAPRRPEPDRREHAGFEAGSHTPQRAEYGRDQYGHDQYGYDVSRGDPGRSDRARGRPDRRRPEDEWPDDGWRDNRAARSADHDGARGGDAWHDERDDDRWEREPSGPRPRSAPRAYGFEVTDERWH